MISLLDARVFHARSRPKKNRFCYRVPYLAIPAADFAHGAGTRLFSFDAANLFGLRRSDYGNDPLGRVRGILADHRLSSAGSDILLLTIPRVLGFGFNPVSFWFCFDHEKKLRAVLAQVTNTFGEQHCYLCFHDDRRPIAPDETLDAEKVFHVSPFLKVEGRYQFRFGIDADRISVKIDLLDEDGLLLATSLVGRLKPLRDSHLLSAFLANPLLMLKVIGLIHYQAAKLFLKGVRHFRKPAPPQLGVSH